MPSERFVMAHILEHIPLYVCVYICLLHPVWATLGQGVRKCVLSCVHLLIPQPVVDSTQYVL